MKYAKSIEEYFRDHLEWEKSLLLLRLIISKTDLKESIKWGIPVYSLANKNIIGIAAFKSYVGLWFYQGALLKDEEKKLINAQEGVTKALRQWRFKNESEIKKNEKIIRKYTSEAIENQKNGLELKSEKKDALIVPHLMQNHFKKNPELKEKFDTFTKFKQNEFIEYIDTAKKEATKIKKS